MSLNYHQNEEKLAAEQREVRYLERMNLRRLRKLHEHAFAEAYYGALNAVEGAGVCFVALNGNRVTVKDGRRIEHLPGQPIHLGNNEDGLACYYIPGGI